MFERAALQPALLFAHIEATRERATEVRPGHVLLGLRIAPRQAVARFLQPLSIEETRAALAPTPSPGDGPSERRTIPYSADTERLLRRAVDEARALKQPLTDEHLLLALFGDADCARVLAEAGLSPIALRDRLIQRAQTPVQVVIGASPDPALLLSAYDPVQHPEFKWVLTQSPFTEIGATACVLTNTSPLQVKALMARWTLMDQDGDTRVHDVVADDYFVYNRFQSLTPGRSVLVTPRGCVEPMTPEQPFCVVVPLNAPPATPVRAVLDVDSVVFANGRIVGPDTYDIGTYIHGRHTAAMELLEQVCAAEDEGEDQGAALQRILRRALNTSPPHISRHWHFPSSGGWLKQLYDLPAPPTFFRS